MIPMVMNMNPHTIKQQIKEEYPYRLELHAHSYPVSRCSEVSPCQLVDIYHKLGYDGVVLTNHYISFTLDELPREERVAAYLAAYEEAKAYAAGLGMRVYLGAEVRFDENDNDYLLYGVDETILYKIQQYFPKGLAAFRKEVSLPHSVLLQAHPFRKNSTPADPTLLDGIEAYNMHCGHNNVPAKAVAYAKQCGFTIIAGGSDFHHKGRGHEGAITLRLRQMPKDSFDVASVLKSGDYVFELGGHSIILP